MNKPHAAHRPSDNASLRLSPETMARLRASASTIGARPTEAADPVMAGAPPAPFHALTQELRPQKGARAAINAATYRAEPDCVAALLPLARLDEAAAARARATAAGLVTRLRAARRPGPVEPLLREYALSAPEVSR